MAGGILPHNVIKGEFYTLVNLAIRAAKIPHMVLNSDTKAMLSLPSVHLEVSLEELYSVLEKLPKNAE